MNEGTQELRREYLELEERSQRERACLLKVINAYGILMQGHHGLDKEIASIKKHVNAEGPLTLDAIEKELTKLKNKILVADPPPAAEAQREEGTGDDGAGLDAACRALRKVMGAVLEDFYPLGAQLEKEASSVRLQCADTVSRKEIDEATREFLEFMRGLKGKISEDFKYVNRTFLALLNQVKELEKVFAKEFGGDDQMKEIEHFEMKINDEVGSIARSFDLHTTISEMKKAVIEKIENIRRAVSARKKDEIKKSRMVQKNVEKLQRRISDAERDAKELSRRAEDLAMVAMKDGLTGLYNRKAFDLKMEGALKGFREKGTPFSLMMFDINDFKQINDTLGHVAGDKVLQKVSESLRESFRENDFVARYGGDEFVVVIERLSKEMAREKIVNLRRNLGKRRFVSHKAGDVSVTVSAGIAVSQDGDTADALIDRADKAMYASKRASEPTG